MKQYTTTGVYSVLLSVSNSCGGSPPFTRTNYITVGQVPVANFTANKTTGCVPMTVQFTNSSVGATSFDWDFGDGPHSSEQNPVKTYSAVGNYTVSLNATSLCGSNVKTMTNYITVGTPVTGANFTADTRSGCIPFTVHFSGNAKGTVKAWLWDFGDGGSSADQNPTHIYQTAGDFTVNLTVLDYCGGHNTSISSNYIHAATAISPPAIKAGGFWTLGEGSGITAQDSSGHGNTGTITSGAWANCPAQGRGYLIFNGSSSYVSIPNSATLSPTEQITMEAWVYPVKQQTAKLIQKRDWDGHGIGQSQYGGWQASIRTADGISHVVSWGGPTVSLNTWSYLVLSYDGTSLKLYVNGLVKNETPVAGKLKTINFDLAIGSDAGNQKFFNGSIANAAVSTYALAPCEVFARYQSFTPQACPPAVNFTANTTSGNAPLTVQFTDLTPGTPSSWSWNFGDGTTSTTQHPVKTYSTVGVYNVTLTASNIFGTNQLTRTGYITVGQVPVTNFSANVTNGCPPLTVQFTDLTTGSPTSWLWNFGDGATSTDHNPARTYSTVGIYNVTLTASNIFGTNQSVRSNYITVGQVPVANFTANVTAGCLPMTVQFSDTSTGLPGIWNWSFGDGATSNLQNPNRTYTTAGSYTVTLIASNNCGNSTPFTSTNYITVGRVPVANFTADITTGCLPMTVQFTDSSAYNPTLWNWTFGDGTTSTAQNPVKTYSTAGVYNVSLIASTMCGSSTSFNRTGYITVGAPAVAFTASPTSGTAPLTVQFNGTSKGTPVTWNWTFGDGTTSVQQNLTHTYTVSGTYNVSLTATNGCGSNTTTKTGYITALGPSVTVWAWLKWLNKPNIPVPTNQMWATLVLDGSSDNNRRYHIQHDQNNTKFEFAIGTANMSSSGKWVQSTTNPVNGTWYLVTGVYNQTSGKMAIYVNGTQEGSWTTADSSGLRGIPGTLQIGGIQAGYPNGKGVCYGGSITCADNTRVRLLDGYVTGVQYFDFVKSPTDILAYYNAQGHPA